jgi:hypothetical protein
MRWVEGNMKYIQNLLENLTVRGGLGNLDVNRRILLNCEEKEGAKM